MCSKCVIKEECFVGCEVLTAVTTNSTIFWDVRTPQLLLASSLLGFLFDNENGDSTFLQNVSEPLKYTTSYPIRQYSS